MKTGHSILLAIAFLLFVSCEFDKQADTELDLDLIQQVKNASSDGSLDFFVLPEPTDYSSIPQDPKNPLNTAKVQLGKMLFFETGLGLDAVNESGIGTYSCGSCHVPSAGFKPGRAQGIGDGGTGIGFNGEGRVRSQDYDQTELDVQGIRPLSVLNVAFVSNTFWNGQFGSYDANIGTEDRWGEPDAPGTEFNDLGLMGPEAQNIEGLHVHRMVINEQVVTELGYKDLFDEAFPDFAEHNRYNEFTGSFAISAYIRTLLTTRAPFQEWLKGDFQAMTPQEKRGAMLFFGKANCSNCHSEPNLGSVRFFALGVNDLHMIPSFNRNPDDLRNLGRGGFTGKEEDMFKFKVPQLYNLQGTPFYFHGSSKQSIRDVVEYFNDAIPENPNVPAEQIATQFRPLDLTEEEIQDLTAFLENGLFDPDLNRYSPDYVLSGNCMPNNDPVSRNELGCD